MPGSDFWIDGDEWEVGYRNLRDGDAEYCRVIRPLMEEYWEKFRPFADKNFTAEFAQHPDARFWEMYLTNTLLDGGKNVVPRAERPSEGPDILIREAGKNLWIEAVTYSAGEDGNLDRVPPMKFDGQAHQVPNPKIELRISTAFSTKFRIFCKYLEKGIVAADDVKMIAINAGKTAIQCDYDGRGSPLTVLYPLGDQYVTFFQGSERTESGYQYRDEIPKTKGDPVKIGMFADSQYSPISACIYSCTTLWNIGWGGRGLALYHNCYCQNPIPPNWHRWDVEWGCRPSDAECEIFRIE